MRMLVGYHALVLVVVMVTQQFMTCAAITSARSWGDPHITTIDGNEYEFHGHGEYVFLKGTDFEIQTRTDYLTPGNKDSTIFVAFAIKDSFGTIEIHLNPSSKTLIVYQNGAQICESSDTPAPCGYETFHIPKINGVLAGGDKIGVQSRGIGHYMQKLTLQGGRDMSVTMESIKPNKSHTSLKGLAGGVVSGNYIASNDSQYNVNSSKPNQLFEFGESWRVNKSQSLFNYSIGNGNYSYYNSFSRPTFYEDYLGNLTHLFNLRKNHNETEINKFNETCNETKVRDECLLAIARSNNETFGEIVNDKYRYEKFLYDLQHNTVPSFTADMPRNWYVNLGNASISLDLSKYTYDNNSGDTLTFRVETNVPKEDWSIDSTGVFSWNVTQKLWAISNDPVTGFKFAFIVHDKFNSTINADLNVNFCGCKETSQCDEKEPGKCNCHDRYHSGTYCQVYTDPCNTTTCFNQALCNASNIGQLPDSGPCAPCPKGRTNQFNNDKQICADIDECSDQYQEADRCDSNSNCSNTNGSYICTCFAGYQLKSNHYECEDIDECKKPSNVTCPKNELCKNTIGNYTCECIGGYTRNKDTTVCIKLEGVSFVFEVTWSVQIGQGQNAKDPDSNEGRVAAKEFLTGKFSSIAGFLDVEIVRIVIRNVQGDTSRSRRDAPLQELAVEYIIHLNSSTDKDGLKTQVQNEIGSNAPNISNIPLISQPTVSIYTGGLCDLKGRTDCDPVSTDCVDNNGEYECTCKHGYRREHANIKNICHDINECQNSSAVHDLCRGGTCLDRPGTWNCSCPPGTVWNIFGNLTNPLYRCQENFTYVGKVVFSSLENLSDTAVNDFVTDKLGMLLGNSSDNATHDPWIKSWVHIRDLYVSTSVLRINRTSLSTPGVFGYDILFTIRMGLSLDSVMTLQDIVSRIADVKNGEHFGVHFTVFNETDNMLCNISNECDVSSTICNTTGGKAVCQCKSGFENTSSSVSCRDINECSRQDQFSCLNGNCQNHFGSWDCACEAGYTNGTSSNDTYKECVDINECTGDNSCGNGNCTNTNGSYYCTCHPGFHHADDNNNTCEDIDECANTTTCKDGKCHNTNGSYHCSCNEGFSPTSDNLTCIDIDECNSTSRCQHGTCNNTNGSFFCYCDNGFSPDAKNKTQSCIDINECSEGKHLCDHGTCNNTEGSYFCSCGQGYRHDNSNNKTCVDIDECQEHNTSSCLGSYTDCYNYNGSWNCICTSGSAKTVNSTAKLCSDDFRFMASLHVLLTNAGTHDGIIKGFIQEKITNAYIDKFPGEQVVIDHIEIKPGTDSLNVTFVLNFALPKTKNETDDIWNDFRDSFCSPTCLYRDTPLILSAGPFVIEGKNQGICTIMDQCDSATTDCVSSDGQINCQCKDGYKNTTDDIATSGCVPEPKRTVVEANFTFTLSGDNNNNTTLNVTLTTLIREAYKVKYANVTFTVIILSIDESTSQAGRRKRAATSDYSCKYKVEFQKVVTVETPPQNSKGIIQQFVEEIKNCNATKSCHNITSIPPMLEGLVIQQESPPAAQNITVTIPTKSPPTTPTKTTTTVTATATEESTDLKTILIITGSVLGSLVLLLVIVVACICRKRKPEKPSVYSIQEQISMDQLGPGYDFTPGSQTHINKLGSGFDSQGYNNSSNKHQESAMYDRFSGGSLRQQPMGSHVMHRVSSLPGLPRYETGAVKVLPDGRPPSPTPDYQGNDGGARPIQGQRSPSPRPDYYHDANIDKRPTRLNTGNVSNGYRHGVSVYPMSRTRSMEAIGPDFSLQQDGPLYARPNKGHLNRTRSKEDFRF